MMETYSDAAKDAADFILNKLLSDDRLMHRYREGDAGITGNLDDYSFMIWGLLELYTAIFDIKYLNAAIKLNNTLLKYFWDMRNLDFISQQKMLKKCLYVRKKFMIVQHHQETL